jgi:hypothetical protein
MCPRISLTRRQIDAALPKVSKGLEKYLRIQAAISTGPTVAISRDFQRAFNGFYKVRKNQAWQKNYYGLLAAEVGKQKEDRSSFGQILAHLRKSTARVEASFASKLLATVDPQQPVLDKIVLSNIGCSLPYSGKKNRLETIVLLHRKIAECYRAYLKTPDGKYLVANFKKCYPKANITEVKMLDLVLWQTRNKQ